MFYKYNSIENHYQQKWIDQCIEKFGSALTKAEYIIEEKIHGANLQLIFLPGEDEYQIASRKQLTDRGFYNVGEVLDTLDLSFLQDLANKHESIIRAYGELFGAGVQKGVNYGGKKRLLFFDMRINDYLCTQEVFFNHFKDHLDLTVPIVGRCSTLQEALEYNTAFNSVLYDAENNECEGIVIKPWKEIFFDNAGSLFYIKKKNAAFMEKKQRVPKPSVEWSNEVNDLRETFLAYLNEERLESVYSKHGRIDDAKQIGPYIGYIMKDAIDTFEKEEDFDRDQLTKDEIKYILSMDNKVREWLLQEVR